MIVQIKIKEVEMLNECTKNLIMIKQLLELVLNAEKKAISLVIVPMRIQDLLAVKFEIELIEGVDIEEEAS